MDKFTHSARVFVNEVFLLANGGIIVETIVDAVNPDVPSKKEGSSMRFSFSPEAFTDAFGIDPRNEDEIIEELIGSTRNVMMTIADHNGKIVIESSSFVAKVLGRNDRKRLELATQEKAEAEVPCGFCDSGKALKLGSSCEECGRAKIGDDEIVPTRDEKKSKSVKK